MDDVLFYCLTNRLSVKDWGQEEMHMNWTSYLHFTVWV